MTPSPDAAGPAESLAAPPESLPAPIESVPAPPTPVPAPPTPVSAPPTSAPAAPTSVPAPPEPPVASVGAPAAASEAVGDEPAGMRVLMLVATSLASDTRVLREASTLAAAGHRVHVIGKQVPPDFVPPAGVTWSSVGAGSVFRPDGAPSLGARALPWPLRLARWALLPTHRNQAFGRWATGAEHDGDGRAFDVVHAHDFTALAVGARLAERHRVPLVYDSHELWAGRPRIGRPTPLQNRREQREEARFGGRADVVITVGEGVAGALRERYGWAHVTVVHNTFPLPDPLPKAPARPNAVLYAGRLAPYRELETIAAASRQMSLPVGLMGPADDTWLRSFDPGRAELELPRPVEEVTRRLTEAGLALVTHSDRWDNHVLAMPNKLFHAVRAGVPVIATDVGELARVVRRYGIGELYRPGDAADLAAAVDRALGRYPELVAAVAAAAPDLSWTSDAERLLETYRRLARVSGVAAGAGARSVRAGASG